MDKYLSATDRVLCCSSCDVVDFVFLDEFFIQGRVLLLREDSIIGFDVVPMSVLSIGR